MTRTKTDLVITAKTVTAWVERYLKAWETNDPSDIAAVFADDGEYHETPYDTDWIGREEIVAGWRSRWDWQQGGWTFDWQLDSLAGAIAVISGIGRYVQLATSTTSGPSPSTPRSCVRNLRWSTPNVSRADLEIIAAVESGLGWSTAPCLGRVRSIGVNNMPAQPGALGDFLRAQRARVTVWVSRSGSQAP